MSLKGKKNVYTCERCGKYVVTIDRDEGVTPFLIPCTFGCKAAMRSAFYRIHWSVEPTLQPEYEWYKPGPEEIAKMSPAMRHHVEQGGLDLRKIKDNPAPLPADGIQAAQISGVCHPGGKGPQGEGH